MLFLVIPHKTHTQYLLKVAKEFGKERAKVKILEKEEDALLPEVFSFFVLRGYRKEAEILNDLRVSNNLPEAFIVEVPPPSLRRPIIRNKIRARIASILQTGPLHGYEIYKRYREKFGKISPRLIYYHLEKGVMEGIFEIVKIEEVDGEFSWGRKSVRKYYSLRAKQKVEGL